MFNTRARLTICGIALLPALLAAGCGGDSGPRYPVEGRVFLDGKPLAGKDGTVALKPDASKGNTRKVASVGVLKSDGSFSIETNGSPGAAPGWYKVVILALEPESNPNDDAIRALAERFESETTTPLSIEVVADPSPGSYDLIVSQ